jgi:hypothetical protein
MLAIVQEYGIVCNAKSYLSEQSLSASWPSSEIPSRSRQMFIHDDNQHRRLGGTLVGLATALLFVVLHSFELIPIAEAFIR